MDGLTFSRSCGKEGTGTRGHEREGNILMKKHQQVVNKGRVMSEFSGLQKLARD